ncbi:MAG: hypothetical protein AAB373_00110 [Patescibacteria group bacterium]
MAEVVGKDEQPDAAEPFAGAERITRQFMALYDNGQLSENVTSTLLRTRNGESVKYGSDVQQLAEGLSKSLRISSVVNLAEGPRGLVPADYLTVVPLNFKVNKGKGIEKSALISSGAVYMIGERIVEARRKIEAGEKSVKLTLRAGDLDRVVTRKNYICPDRLKGLWPHEIGAPMPLSQLLSKGLEGVSNVQIVYGEDKPQAPSKRAEGQIGD